MKLRELIAVLESCSKEKYWFNDASTEVYLVDKETDNLKPIDRVEMRDGKAVLLA